MGTLNDVSNLQRNHVKQEIVHGSILDQITAFSNQTPDISYIGLPGLEWNFERKLIRALKIKGVKPRILGVENGYDDKQGKLFTIMESNKPRGATAIEANFDDAIKTRFDNVVWGDYCGHAAEFVMRDCNNKPRYAYPHIEAFVERAKAAIANQVPTIFYLTFCCNGRVIGGKKNLIRALGGKNCKYMVSAIRNKISSLSSREHLTCSITEILRISYKGSLKSNMVTFGFAIGFKPSFPAIDYDLSEIHRSQAIEIKDGVVSVEQEKIPLMVLPNPIALRKQAIKDLSDKGWKSPDIALALNVSVRHVGATLAHHRHPESFKKASNLLDRKPTS